MEELHTDSIDGGHEASYGARSRARERAYSNKGTFGQVAVLGPNELKIWKTAAPRRVDRVRLLQ
jgi:hypothetical protein